MKKVDEIYHERGTFLTEKHPLLSRVSRYFESGGVREFDHSKFDLDYIARRFIIGYSGKIDNYSLTVGVCYEKDPTAKSVLVVRLLNSLSYLFKESFVIFPDIEYYGRYGLTDEEYRGLVESIAKVFSYYSRVDFKPIRESDPRFSLMASRISNYMMPSDIADILAEGLHEGEGSNVFQNIASSYHTASYFLPYIIKGMDSTTLLESVHMSPRRLIANRLSSAMKMPMKTGSIYMIARPLSLKFPNSVGHNSEDMVSLDIDTVEEKMRNAITGGRDRKVDQVKYGGDFMNCPAFQNYVVFSEEERCKSISKQCSAGRLCGDCKSDMISDLKRTIKEINRQPTSKISEKILLG